MPFAVKIDAVHHLASGGARTYAWHGGKDGKPPVTQIQYG
jgi:hypothetical protein